MRKSAVLAICLYFMTAAVCFASSHSPHGMLQTVSNDMLSALKTHKVTLQNNPDLVHRLVKRILMPHVDRVGMARSVVGRNAWMAATPSQRQRFTNEFMTTVIRTYSSALAEYDNETIDFLPMRGSISGRRRVQVDSKIVRKGAPPVKVSYRCILKGGQWFVYDMSVEGISMLQSFRSQFAADLSQGGLKRLTDRLAEHNNK